MAGIFDRYIVGGIREPTPSPLKTLGISSRAFPAPKETPKKKSFFETITQAATTAIPPFKAAYELGKSPILAHLSAGALEKSTLSRVTPGKIEEKFDLPAEPKTDAEKIARGIGRLIGGAPYYAYAIGKVPALAVLKKIPKLGPLLSSGARMTVASKAVQLAEQPPTTQREIEAWAEDIPADLASSLITLGVFAGLKITGKALFVPKGVSTAEFNAGLEAFGLKPGATTEEAKKVYAQLAHEFHPDVSVSPDAESLFTTINAHWKNISGFQPPPINIDPKGKLKIVWDKLKEIVTPKEVKAPDIKALPAEISTTKTDLIRSLAESKPLKAQETKEAGALIAKVMGLGPKEWKAFSGTDQRRMAKDALETLGLVEPKVPATTKELMEAEMKRPLKAGEWGKPAPETEQLGMEVKEIAKGKPVFGKLLETDQELIAPTAGEAPEQITVAEQLKPEKAPEEALNEVVGLIYLGDEGKAKALLDTLKKDFEVPEFEELAQEAYKAQETEIGGFDELEAEFGQYKDQVRKHINIVRLAGEKTSKKTGELLREHVPEGKGRISSDEMADVFGMAENDYMNYVVEKAGITGDYAKALKPVVGVRIRKEHKKAAQWFKKLPRAAKQWFERLPKEGFKVIREQPLFTGELPERGKVPSYKGWKEQEIPLAVHAEPTEKTLERFEKKETQAKMRTEKDFVKSLGREAREKLRQRIKDVTDMIKETTGLKVNISEDFVAQADQINDLGKPDLLHLNALRATEKMDGQKQGIVKKTLYDPVEEALDSYNQEVMSIQEKTKKNLPYKANSKDSALLQQYGEQRLSEEELAKLPDEKLKELKQADRWLRQQYDDLLKTVNDVRVKHGKEPIPERTDYYTHFNEISILDRFFGGLHKIPNEIIRASAYTKPDSPFNPHALARQLGAPFKDDAVGGWNRYYRTVLKEIHFTKPMVNIRGHAKFMPGNAALYWDEVANSLAGKTDPVDRAVFNKLPRQLQFLTGWLRRRLGENLVIANFGSVLIQPSSVTLTIAETGWTNTLLGHTAYLNPESRAFAEAHSRVLRSRKPELEINYQEMGKVKKFASWLFNTADREMVGGSFMAGVEKAKSQGLPLSEQVAEGDRVATLTQAEYRRALRSPIMRSETGKTLLQFQTFCIDALGYLGYDIPKIEGKPAGWKDKKTLSKLFRFVLAAFLVNELYDKAVGRRPWQPSQIIPFAGEGRFGSPPVLQTLQTLKGAKSYPGATESERTQIKNDIKRQLRYLTLPWGGNQLRKTFEGLQAYQEGKSLTPSGNLRFEVEQNFSNFLRTLLFGPWSTPEAQEYLESFGKKKEAPKKTTMEIIRQMGAKEKTPSAKPNALEELLGPLLPKKKAEANPFDQYIVP